MKNKIKSVILLCISILFMSCSNQIKKSNIKTKYPLQNERNFVSQKTINSQRDSILKEIGYEPTSKNSQYFYYYKTSENVISKKKMFDIMVAMNKGIDSIFNNKGEVRIFTHYDNMKYFYAFTSDFYRFEYCTWNDIYKTIFSFNDIDSVVWYNENIKSTIFPSGEEWPTIHPPQKVMKKKWYIEDLNYNLILDEDNKHFNSDWVIINENYMDSIILANKNLKFKPRKCFEPKK